ncbi:MAG: HAMP domain-containing histidine kinase, partial [Lachnospiraceae bacterium]|nr:HAMP domain-containing histidine kinase [Lachnospiraceae bacterium]
MIKNLRRKFIAVTMLSVVIVLALLMGMINYANFRNVNRNLDMRLNLIEENGGTLPAFDPGQGRGPRKDFFADGPDEDEPPAAPPIKPDGNSTPFAPPDGAGEFPGGRDDTPFIRSGLSGESLFDTRFFTVTIDDTGSVSAVNADNIATVTEEQAASIALLLFQKGRTSGYKNEYKFRAVPNTDGDDSPVTMYIFLNAGRELDTLHNFLFATVAVSIIGTLLVFLLVVILSKIVVRPVAESYEKQKRFITDASHEIKTPLAIIGANIEVVEMENGESEWTKSIRNQITRLASLTEKLVFLSRMDEEGTSLVMEELDLSELVTESAEGFMGSAKSSGRTLTLAVAPHLTIRGERATLT